MNSWCVAKTRLDDNAIIFNLFPATEDTQSDASLHFFSTLSEASLFATNGKKITTAIGEYLHHKDDIYKVVDSVPFGYLIWNIGKNMVDGYLPLCRLAASQPFPGGRNIEPTTLLAIKCERAQDILSATINGIYTIADAEKFIEKNKDAKPGTCLWHSVERAKKALPYMKQIKGL